MNDATNLEQLVREYEKHAAALSTAKPWGEQLNQLVWAKKAEQTLADALDEAMTAVLRRAVELILVDEQAARSQGLSVESLKKGWPGYATKIDQICGEVSCDMMFIPAPPRE